MKRFFIHCHSNVTYNVKMKSTNVSLKINLKNCENFEILIYKI